MRSKVELEEDVCYLQKKIDEIEAIVRQKTIALKHATAELNEVRARYQHNWTNYTFMKRKAERVELDEYKETRKNMSEARDMTEDAFEKVQRLVRSMEFHLAELGKLQGNLKKRRAVRQKGYGKVLQLFGERT